MHTLSTLPTGKLTLAPVVWVGCIKFGAASCSPLIRWMPANVWKVISDCTADPEADISRHITVTSVTYRGVKNSMPVSSERSWPWWRQEQDSENGQAVGYVRNRKESDDAHHCCHVSFPTCRLLFSLREKNHTWTLCLTSRSTRKWYVFIPRFLFLSVLLFF